MRRIKRAKIKFISLVPRGANQMPVIYKEDGAVAFDLLTKAGANFDEKGELLSVVYAPEVRDSQGDIASAEVIKQMMYDAAKEGVQIDLRHNETPVAKADAYIAESFLIQKGDARFADFKDYNGKVVDVAGAWAVVIKIDSPDLRKQYKEGKWNGVSMGGTAELLNEKSDNPENPGDPTMTAAELIAALGTALAANNAALTKAITEGTTAALTDAGVIKKKADPAAPAVESAEPQPPKFKGSPTNIEDVRKHAAALKAYNLAKSVDWNDPEAVATHLALVEEMAKADGTHVTDEEAGITETDSPRERVLKKELAKIKKASNQPAKTEDDKKETSTTGFVGMQKSKDLDASISLASKMIAHVSGSKTPAKAAV